MTQEESDKSYISIAEVWARNSKAQRLKVGAIVVSGTQIISDGFNGTPSGFDNECEYEVEIDGNVTLKTKPEVIHAEANAIAKLARSTQSSEGATMYVTHSPCVECAKQIIQAGIKRVVYHIPYRSDEGLKLLKRAKIEIKEI